MLITSGNTGEQTAAGLLSKEEKERILRTIETDIEFRYAVAGAIGILEVLKRLDSIEARIEEHTKGIQETSRRIEEISRRIEELTRRIEELSERIEEHTKILGEHTMRIERLEKGVAELKISVGSLGRRIGLDLEKTILSVYRDLLLGLGIEDVDRIERFVYVDPDGRYLGRGAKIEVDIYVHDGEVYLVEVKNLAEEEDVEWFNKKCEMVESIIGRKSRRRIIVAVNTTKEAVNRARELGIDVVYGSLVE